MKLLYWALSLIAAAFILFQTWRIATFVSLYSEAEPLHPVATKFSQALSKKIENRELQLSDLENLLSEKEFKVLQNYGFLISNTKDPLITFKINEKYRFPIFRNGSAGFDSVKTEQDAAANP